MGAAGRAGRRGGEKDVGGGGWPIKGRGNVGGKGRRGEMIGKGGRSGDKMVKRGKKPEQRAGTKNRERGKEIPNKRKMQNGRRKKGRVKGRGEGGKGERERACHWW